MSKCLVTGGAGFIGSHLVDKLIEDGHEVLVVDNLMLGKKDFINKDAVFFEEDIRDLGKMEELCKDVDVIFHLAADPRLQMSVEDPLSTHEINVTGTLNMLIAAQKNNVKKFIFSSSCATYGDLPLPIKEENKQEPLSPYGMHKKIGEEYCRLFSSLYNLDAVCLRYFNVFGPRKTADGGYPMVIPIFLKQKSEGKKMTVVGNGKQTRDYVYVNDVVDANIKAWQSDVKDGDGINIGMGKEISVNEIASLIGGETVNIDERLGEMKAIQADNTKAKKLLGWEPTITLESGIEELKKELGLN
jgi:nucleoside-diphosphate-sugar epimerase